LYLKPPAWDFQPGQFVMVRPGSWENDPVWPRPFSICEKTEAFLRLFIQVAGRGTRRLSRLKPGDLIHVWGPLGNGFEYDHKQPLLMLAGGMGMAPFVGLVKQHPVPDNASLVLGHRGSAEHYPISELAERMSIRALRQDTAEDILEFQKFLEKNISSFSSEGRILACGPVPFLRFIQDQAGKYKADAWISLENKMACGIGVCLGCTARTVLGEYRQTCTYGPVFRADSIVLEP
ncbi:MAG: dihydroorotate dehydrogenase electron transfer subunit, partial [Desulfonatronovibrionaceae bacterium]